MNANGECVDVHGNVSPPKVCPDETTMNAEGECIGDNGIVTPPQDCPQSTAMDAEGNCDELASDDDVKDRTQVLGEQVTNTGDDDVPSVGSEGEVAPAAAPRGAALAFTGGNVLPLVLVALALLISGLVLLKVRRPN
jgi:hypothetical protein